MKDAFRLARLALRPFAWLFRCTQLGFSILGKFCKLDRCRIRELRYQSSCLLQSALQLGSVIPITQGGTLAEKGTLTFFRNFVQ